VSLVDERRVDLYVLNKLCCCVECCLPSVLFVCYKGGHPLSENLDLSRPEGLVCDFGRNEFFHLQSINCNSLRSCPCDSHFSDRDLRWIFSITRTPSPPFDYI